MSETPAVPEPFVDLVDDFEPSRRWARTRYALWTSEDDGATWSKYCPCPGWADDLVLHDGKPWILRIRDTFWRLDRKPYQRKPWVRSETPEMDAYTIALRRRRPGEPRPRFPMAELLESESGVLQLRRHSIGCGGYGWNRVSRLTWSPNRATLTRWTGFLTETDRGYELVSRLQRATLDDPTRARMVRAVLDALVRPEVPGSVMSTSWHSLSVGWTLQKGTRFKRAEFETHEEQLTERDCLEYPPPRNAHNYVHAMDDLTEAWAAELGWTEP